MWIFCCVTLLFKVSLFSALKTKSSHDMTFVFIDGAGACHNDCWWSMDSFHKGLVKQKAFKACHDVVMQVTKFTWACFRFVVITHGPKYNFLIRFLVRSHVCHYYSLSNLQHQYFSCHIYPLAQDPIKPCGVRYKRIIRQHFIFFVSCFWQISNITLDHSIFLCLNITKSFC